MRVGSSRRSEPGRARRRRVATFRVDERARSGSALPQHRDRHLVQDLSEGVDVERAVKSSRPRSRRRTTSGRSAVITPAMVKKAMETIESLGLEPALERRFAVIGDISVNDVKWVDSASKPLMKGGSVACSWSTQQRRAQRARRTTRSAPRSSASTTHGADLARDDGMEVLFKGQHLGNLMSLTAPLNPEPKQLFRWDNGFAWSCAGNVADSIAERVKKAGGKVEGALLRVSLSWFNFDDLDLHIIEPQGRGIAGALGRICSTTGAAGRVVCSTST